MIQTGKKKVTMSLVPSVLRFALRNRASHCHMFPHRMITVINDSPAKLTDIRPTVDRYTTDSWPICHRHMTDIRSRCVVEISTDNRPIVYPTIDWLSTDGRPTVDRLSTDYRPLYRPLYRPIDRSTLPTVNKSATASETINAFVLVRRFLELQTRKIVNPFPMIARNKRTQPRMQNQVSILTVKGSSCQLYWLTIIIYIFPWISGSHFLNTRKWFYGRPRRLI